MQVQTWSRPLFHSALPFAISAAFLVFFHVVRVEHVVHLLSLRTLNCTYDGFCTGEGGPTIQPATNYIPEEQVKKKEKEKQQKVHFAHIEEGFRGGSRAEQENNESQGKYPTSIPRATASSNARERLTMRSRA